ncbi:hypothetical protein H9P43_002555 [Blastocladiella emersonii ATCC 22665]|nr:hypothetical protein H9P43_002555 [Blastocladiella emersonii ATCC 22665]
MECASQACVVITKYVVPSFGAITAIVTGASPVFAVRKIRVSKDMGSNNPVPYPFIFLNALIWIEYGLLIRDIFVVAPNIVGLLFGGWFVRSVYGLTTPGQQRLMDLIVIVGTAAIFLTSTVAFLWLTPAAGRLALGILSVIILGLFYTSPLTVLYQVIANRDSTPFSAPLACACLVNGGLWTVYGFVLGDGFIYGPNILGAAFAVVQLTARTIFPARGAAAADKGKTEGEVVPMPATTSKRSSVIPAGPK